MVCGSNVLKFLIFRVAIFFNLKATLLVAFMDTWIKTQFGIFLEVVVAISGLFLYLGKPGLSGKPGLFIAILEQR